MKPIHKWYGFLGILFIINLIGLWPGQMTGDSQTQYKGCLAGDYGYHHPPIMGVVWRQLHRIMPGSGLMFLFHLLMLYLAAGVLFTLFYPSRISFLYLFLPLFPHIALYSSLIWKDVGLGLSYLLAGSLLSYCALKKWGNWYWYSVIIAALFYGSLVKFQARYVAPLLIAWFVGILFKNRFLTQNYWITFFGCCLLLYSAQYSFNRFWIGEVKENHTWQHVKLYDLAGMSVLLDKELFPDFVKQHKRYSWQEVKNRLNYTRVDDLVGLDNPPLDMGKNDEERQQLLQYWIDAIQQYPLLYLKHRFTLWWTMMNNYPLQQLAALDLNEYGGLSWLSYYPTIKYYLITILSVLCALLSFKFFLPLLLFYFLLSLLSWYKTDYALPLFFFSAIAISFLGVLFITCMTSTTRYIYLVYCMFHACHGFAYKIIRGYW